MLAMAGVTRAEDDAAKILKISTDYVAAQKSISATFDSDIEVITPDLPKIQFASSGQMKLSRPDKLRIRRTGGYANVELTFDGKTLTIFGNNAKSYIQADEPGTVDHVIDVIQSAAGAAMPGTDLLLTHAYDVCRVGFAPTGKRRLCTVHARNGHWHGLTRDNFRSEGTMLSVVTLERSAS
jgi:hypothetical protein